MPGIDQRIFKAAWTLFLFVLLLAGLYTVRQTIVVFTLALFFALLLEPAIEFASRLAPRRVSRLAVLAVVYVLIVGAITSLIISIGSRVAEQAAGLAAKLPETLQQDPLAHMPLPEWLEPMRDRLAQVLGDRITELDKEVLPILTKAGSEILSGLGNVLSLVLVPILAFFFLKDGAEIRRAVIGQFYAANRATVDGIFEDLHFMLTRYIRALVLLSMATFLTHVTFFSVVGVPYGVLLAGIAAILELIPVLGPVTAGAIVLLVAGFSGYPHLLWILIFLVVYRVFQDYVLNPQLMGSGVELHPVLVLFGIVAGEQIAGIPGMFFAIPSLAALRVLLRRLQTPHV
jgi:predicted PurR-regulated permease PerM